MKLQPFKYIPAENLQVAEALLKEYEGRAAVIASWIAGVGDFLAPEP